MFCRQCGYPLDYAAGRHCPECGLWFEPGSPHTWLRRPPNRAMMAIRQSVPRWLAKYVMCLIPTAIGGFVCVLTAVVPPAPLNAGGIDSDEAKILGLLWLGLGLMCTIIGWASCAINDAFNALDRRALEKEMGNEET